MPADASPALDLLLMEAVARGDREALARLYDRHAGLVLAICRRVLHDGAEAEDVLTDIFFELWSKADRFDASRGSFVTYLVTLSRSRALDRRRFLLARGLLTAEPAQLGGRVADGPTPFQASDKDEQTHILRQSMQALSPAQREALESAFFEGLSHTEVAAKLNRPLGTIKTHIREGLIHLRDCLRKHYKGTENTER